uniref:Uncharacterized protein ycf33 n=1 Tax=Cryptomonas curvata TaxID=233186 RepID=A0A222AHJ5_9CRYP|nr:putative plastid protein 33 [Cryptomonas curvata]ASO75848.1 putative plastid protein 33 [Cryptomonas curvata]
MSDFWDNIFRFPRFFVSSTLGLILTIIGPFFNLLRSPNYINFSNNNLIYTDIFISYFKINAEFR